MTQVSCSNGRVIVDKGLIKKIEETWYGDQFNIEETLSFISEDGSQEFLKFENERVEPKIKSVKYHWPETDSTGIREGYAYDQTLRAHVSAKKLVDFAEFSYSTEDGSKFKRNIEVFFLKKTQFSIFGINTVVKVDGGENGKKGTFQWVLNTRTTAGFLKKGL